MKRTALAALLACTASCGPAGNDPGPGGVTVDEAKALDEAAEMLDQRRLPDDALPNDTPPNDTTSDDTNPRGPAGGAEQAPEAANPAQP